MARTLIIPFLFSVVLIACSGSDETQTIQVAGLTQPVEVIRDQWGINHIYAQNQADLFFAQGYCAARDRLFQFEIWRRQATGTVAELLGPREIRRDHGTRLFKFRGDMKQEMNHYHPEGEAIITAYVRGVNAYIDEIMQTPEQLPLSFHLLGTYPRKWTPEVVISRHQGLLGNIEEELATGRAVALIGEQTVKQLEWFHPKEPLLSLDTSINQKGLFQDVIGLYQAYRKGLVFRKEDLVIDTHKSRNNSELSHAIEEERPVFGEIDWTSIGSNNWVLSGQRTLSGKAIMANDPHRVLAVPSLRYMAHLVAPGWDVIGGGEPEIPGISIGHNPYGAWGLTVFETDGEDLYVYDLNPDNLLQYNYQGEWEDMEVITDTLHVKGAADVVLDLHYTRHGPVTYIDTVRAQAYAIRCAWLEPGGSPYLASLRMDQAKSWEEFREACAYSHIPGENMVWADQDGTIGWQAVGIAPLRRNFSGLVPVSGDGRYEWDGYLPIKEKPSLSNPPEGFFATANQNVIPEHYDQWDAIAFSWADPFRGDRINEILSSNHKFTMDEMKSLQTDYLSIPARTLVPMLAQINFEDEFTREAASILTGWDFRLLAESTAAGIYVAWENQIRKEAKSKWVPKPAHPYLSPQLHRIIEWMEHPELIGENERSCQLFLKETFGQALAGMRERLGDDVSKWEYGQENYKHVTIRHPLSDAVNDSLKALLDQGPLPRGGNAYTPGATGNAINQTSGASFRFITEAGNWDATWATNTPGQSGDPSSPFYHNLFKDWAADRYFPVVYRYKQVEKVAAERVRLTPP